MIVPNFPFSHPFFGRNKVEGLKLFAGGIIFSGNKFCSNQFPVNFVGINIISSFGMLHDGVSVRVMEVIEVFVARSKAVKNGPVRLC